MIQHPHNLCNKVAFAQIIDKICYFEIHWKFFDNENRFVNVIYSVWWSTEFLLSDN